MTHEPDVRHSVAEGLEVEWDPDKARDNVRKHGVDFVDAATVFLDPYARSADDAAHSQTEQREVTIGLMRRGQLVVVAHTLRAGRIRVISARRATTQERRDYEH